MNKFTSKHILSKIELRTFRLKASRRAAGEVSNKAPSASINQVSSIAHRMLNRLRDLERYKIRNYTEHKTQHEQKHTGTQLLHSPTQHEDIISLSLISAYDEGNK